MMIITQLLFEQLILSLILPQQLLQSQQFQFLLFTKLAFRLCFQDGTLSLAIVFLEKLFEFQYTISDLSLLHHAIHSISMREVHTIHSS